MRVDPEEYGIDPAGAAAELNKLAEEVLGIGGASTFFFKLGAWYGARLMLINQPVAFGVVVHGHAQESPFYDLVAAHLADTYRDIIESRMAFTLFQSGFNGNTEMQVKDPASAKIISDVTEFLKRQEPGT